MSLADLALSELAAIDEAGLTKHELLMTGRQGAHVEVAGHGQLINLCANNYLGLAAHPEIVAAARGAVRRRARDWLGRRDHPARRRCARRPLHGARAADQNGRGRQHRRDRLEDLRRQPHLWGALTSRTAVFRIAAGRHAFEARTLLGERFAGIVCSDRWRGYDLPRPNPTAALLGLPPARLHRPQRRSLRTT